MALPPKLEEVIQNLIDKESFTNYSVESKKINPNGAGFMGDLYEVDLKGTANGESREINLFIKHIISNAEQMTIYSVEDVFAREALAYNELSPALEELQTKAGIPYKLFKMVKNYGSNKDVIVLQDISKKGYKMNFRMDVISVKYAEMSIKELARFHGLSLVLERQRPKHFEVFKCLKPAFIFGELWDDFANNISKSSIKLLDDSKREKYGDKILDIVGKYESYICDTDNFNTLCHGDYKHNNIMYKETELCCAIHTYNITSNIQVKHLLRAYGLTNGKGLPLISAMPEEVPSRYSPRTINSLWTRFKELNTINILNRLLKKEGGSQFG